MPIAEELIAVLGFKVEGQQALRRYKQGIDGAEQKTRKSGLAMRRAALAGGALGGAMLAAGGFAVSSARKFAGLEREMNRIGITAGASAERTEEVTTAVQNLAIDTALPIDQVVAGLDTLVASGFNLDEAMSFLPSVAITAQASGASLVDIANTAQKVSSALGISAEDMQRAFDIMVVGGKEGQFELRDMAAYIPTLSNLFANLGTTGEEGLTQLIAVMQTLREDTGTAGEAATQAQNIFSKMYSAQTAKKFSEFGIDLRKEMEAATAAGETALDAFVRLSKEAIDGDLTKIPLLFTDLQFQQGMTSLMTSADSYNRFLDAVRSGDVDGSSLRDFMRVTQDTQASIDRMSTQWEKFVNNVGKSAAQVLTPLLEGANDDISFSGAIRRGLELEGNAPEGIRGRAGNLFMSIPERQRLARLGGYTGDKLNFDESGIGQSKAMAELKARLTEVNANLADMASGATLQADITDASQDNRDQSVNPNVSITQYVQQATDAALAAANVTGSAVSNAVQEQARIAQEPATSP